MACCFRYSPSGSLKDILVFQRLAPGWNQNIVCKSNSITTNKILIRRKVKVSCGENNKIENEM